jgi:uncharacterized protein (TIGR02246 family)
MKTSIHRVTGIALAMFASPGLRAEEPSPEIAGLEKAAADFVIAYNNKDAAGLAALFTAEGEITDLAAEDVTTGRDEIKAHYEEVFAEKEVASAAIEVDSVRLVGTNLAVEDGTVHFTFPGENFAARSSAYSAVLQKNEAGVWQIASTRTLRDVTGPAGHLDDLLNVLKGDWTCQKDDTRFDLAVGWDESGQYVTGELLVTKADSKPLASNLRFGWDAARKTITCWTFDDAGGFAKADWTQVDDTWQVRTEGTTAEGEAMSANQTLTFEGKDTFIWSGKDRLIDGEDQPEARLRFVRQAPEPEADAE